MYGKLTTAALFLGALRLVSAESCTPGKWSCQGLSTALCVYTSGVAGSDGKYATDWVNLDVCKSRCEMSSANIAECVDAGSGGVATTLATVTKAITSISKAASPTSVSVSASKGPGGIFAATSVKPVSTPKPTTLSPSVVVKTSSTAPASAPTSPASGSSSGNVIVASPMGMSLDATFYYDINGGGTCGPVSNVKAYPETNGYTTCEPTDVQYAKTIAQHGTNNIVAMSIDALGPNKAKYCGKKVVVTYEGVRRDDLNLFIWDGCAACNANGGLDFSSTIFAEIAGADHCKDGRIENKMTWEIVDETILPYKAIGSE